MNARGGGGRNRRRLMMTPPPPKLVYENLADSQEDKDEEAKLREDERQGVFGRFFGGMRAAISNAFGWCNDRDEDELLNEERACAEILSRHRATFIDNYR